MKEIIDRGSNTKPLLLRVNKRSAMNLAQNPSNHPKTKHIRSRYHVIRNAIWDGFVTFEWVPTSVQAADSYTEGMLAGRLEHVKALLGLLEVSKRWMVYTGNGRSRASLMGCCMDGTMRNWPTGGGIQKASCHLFIIMEYDIEPPNASSIPSNPLSFLGIVTSSYGTVFILQPLNPI